MTVYLVVEEFAVGSPECILHDAHTTEQGALEQIAKLQQVCRDLGEVVCNDPDVPNSDWDWDRNYYCDALEVVEP